MKKSKIEMSWRGWPMLGIVCILAWGVAVNGQKLTPAKEFSVQPEPGDSTFQLKTVSDDNKLHEIAIVRYPSTNNLSVVSARIKSMDWEKEKVTVSRPHWLLATNWLTVSYIIPATGLQGGPQAVPVLQKSSVTSNLVIGVSWHQSGATNEMTNTFVLQSVPVPEWSGADRVSQEQVNR